MRLDPTASGSRSTLRFLTIPTFAALLLAAAAAGAAAAPAARPKVDFSLYQDLLTEHVWTVSEPGQPLETRFNYELLYDQKGRSERLFRIRRQFLSVDPASLDLKSRRAWAINFYNFLVIEQTTDHLLIPGKVRQRILSVRDIRPEGGEFFKRAVVKIDTVKYSLDEFEKHFLFEDFDRKPGTPLPATLDPRVHFAIVCGAIGCPPLQPRAFRPESLDVQLDAAVRHTLASPAHYIHTAGAPSVRLSALFFWYAPDFGGEKAVLPWVAKYLPKPRRAELEAVRERAMTAQINWDWKLNQVVGWRFHYQMEKGTPQGAARDTT